MSGLGMKALSTLDFNNKATPTNQAKALLATTITGRLLFSRGQEEFRETFTRDIPGFFTFYYLAGVVENSLGYLLDKFSKTSAEKGAYTLIKGPEERSIWNMLNPFTKKFKIRSFDDIESLKKLTTEKNYKELLRNKSILYVIGLAIPIVCLGILIPRFNVFLTRKNVKSENMPVQNNYNAVSGLSNSKDNKYGFSNKCNFNVKSQVNNKIPQLDYFA